LAQSDIALTCAARCISASVRQIKAIVMRRCCPANHCSDAVATRKIAACRGKLHGLGQTLLNQPE
jgi:hypothetical protein